MEVINYNNQTYVVRLMQFNFCFSFSNSMRVGQKKKNTTKKHKVKLGVSPWSCFTCARFVAISFAFFKGSLPKNQ